MFKKLFKYAAVGTLLATQYPAFRNGQTFFLAGFGSGLLIGIFGILLLQKSYAWTHSENNIKKAVGYTVLAVTALGLAYILVSVGYNMYEFYQAHPIIGKAIAQQNI